MSFLKDRKGFLLPMVIIYMVVALMIGNGILLLGSMQTASASTRLYRAQAFYLAEAGLNYARSELKQNSAWVPALNPYTQTLGAGSYRIYVDKVTSPTQITIASTGTVKGITACAVLTLTKSGGVFSQGIFGGSQIDINGTSEIRGYDSRTGASTSAYVGSDSAIDISAGGHIYGDVSVSSGGAITNPGSVSGDISTSAVARPLEPVTIPADLLSLPYTSYGAPGLSGSYTLSGGNYNTNGGAVISSGSYHFRSLTFAGVLSPLNISGNVRLYIEGAFAVYGLLADVRLSTGSKVAIYMGAASGTVNIGDIGGINYNNSPSNLGIYVASDLAVNIGGARINAAIYAPLSTVNLTISELRGGVVADRTVLNNGPFGFLPSRIYSDIALQDISPPGDPGGSGIAFVKWTKPGWKIQ